MIKYYSYHELDPNLKAELLNYVSEEFGDVPFVKERVWAEPDYVFIKYDGDVIATFYNVVLRNVALDEKVFKVAGINNVITPKQFRGRGYATQTLRETEHILFDELKCDYGLLLCADALVSFYNRMNWYKADAELYYDQPEGKQLYDSNTMLFSPTASSRIIPRKIDLNGLPW